MRSQNTAHFAATVRRALAESGRTQDEIAKRGGPSDTTLRRIMDGVDEVGISSITLRKLDAGFGWSPGSAARILSGESTTAVEASEDEALPASDWEASTIVRQADAFASAFEARDAIAARDALYTMSALVDRILRSFADPSANRTGDGDVSVSTRADLEDQEDVLAYDEAKEKDDGMRFTVEDILAGDIGSD